MFSLKPKIRAYGFPLLLLALVFGMMLVSSYVYLRETSAFRFFDEENNIVAGYFLTTGKHLYSDIFMNHNPLPIFISAGIQETLRITTLFELVKYHRMFMIGFALCANSILLIRFRHKAFLFIFVYEFLKFYLSGQMFLAEGMIAYPLAYMVLLLTTTGLVHKKISNLDLTISSCCFIFIALSREPYVPVTLVIFGLILFFTHSRKMALYAGIISLVLIGMFMLQFDLSEYYKQVVLLNRALAKGDLKDQGNLQMYSGLLQLFQYVIVGMKLDKPVYIVLSAVSAAFLYLVGRKTHSLKGVGQWLFLVIVFGILFLAGIRNYSAGSEWYGMYRSIPYIAILLAFVSSIASARLIVTLLCFTLGVAIFHPRSHFREKRINADEYYIQYSRTNQTGQVINLLCSKYPHSCTLHIDDIDVYPYWITKKPPSYQYIFYYPVNKAYLDYKQIHLKALLDSPPIIYYDGSCMVDPTHLPKSLESQFVFLREFSLDTGKEKQACIAVNRKLLPYIDDDIKSAISKHNLKFGVQ